MRGFRIETGEIEQALRADPRVGDAVVMARADGPGEKRLVAYVVARDGAAPDAGGAARGADGAAAVVPGPRRVRAAGCPSRSRPTARWTAARCPRRRWTAGTRSWPPRTPTEEVLAGIWAELLGAARVGAEDDFFALGGHSLMATQVISRVRQAFGVELPLRDLFEAPVLGALRTVWTPPCATPWGWTRRRSSPWRRRTCP